MMASDKKQPPETDDAKRMISADRVSDPSDESQSGSDLPPEDTVLEAMHLPKEQSLAPQGRLQRLRHWLATHKKVSIASAILVVLAMLAAVPFTRYAIAGTFLTQTYTVRLLEEQSGKPISSVKVTAGSNSTTTDSQGRARLKLPVGTRHIVASKKYYTSASTNVLVPIMKQKGETTLRMKATGRQVAIKVVNRITEKPLANVLVKALDTEAKTDKSGKTVIVLPADRQTIAATLSMAGYLELTAEIQVTDQQTDKNNFSLVPSGKVYFLSNQSGTIDVVKSNLDGSKREIIVAGTGKEDRYNTQLVATRDWKYLALHSRRDGGKEPKLFLIDTASDKITTIDEGTADFTVAGWSGHNLIYTVYRKGYQPTQPKAYALKSFKADTRKLIILDESQADTLPFGGYANEQFHHAIILDKEIVYTKEVSANYTGSIDNHRVREASLNSVSAEGDSKKVIKAWLALQIGSLNFGYRYSSVEARLYGFNELYARSSEDVTKIYEYENGQIKDVPKTTQSDFYRDYPDYLVSPSSERTLWTETRDGKSVFFVGNAHGEDGKQIASLDRFSGYGWFTDQYILASKNGNELYIMSVDGDQDPVKIADYYRPVEGISAYGYGYSGL